MLERLYGPVPLTYGGEEVYFLHPPFWHDAVGLIGDFFVGEEFVAGVAQLDGVVYERADLEAAGQLSANLVTGGLAAHEVVDGETFFWEHCDVRVFHPYGEALDATGFGGDFSPPWTVLPDRYIHARNGKVYAWVDGAREEEFEVCLAAEGPNAAMITPAAEYGKVWIAWGETGRFYLYDWIAKETIGSPRYVEPFEFGFFSAYLGVFVTVQREPLVDRVVVWAQEPKPETIAGPTLLDDAVAGRIIRARVVVTGEYLSERCAGLVVDWSTTVGTVLDPATVTDATGVADTRIRIAPGEVAGLVDVTAEVRL